MSDQGEQAQPAGYVRRKCSKCGEGLGFTEGDPCDRCAAQPAEEQADALYPMWRFHLWHVGFGSYSKIEAAIIAGQLRPFTCPKADCDCKWPKASVGDNAPQPSGGGGAPERPLESAIFPDTGQTVPATGDVFVVAAVTPNVLDFHDGRCTAVTLARATQAATAPNDLISREVAISIADARLNDVPDPADLQADRSLFAAGYLAAAGSIKAALERMSATPTDVAERAQRAADKFNDRLVQDYAGLTVGHKRLLADIIAAEFGEGDE